MSGWTQKNARDNQAIYFTSYFMNSLALRHILLHPHWWWRVGYPPDKDTESVALEEEVGHAPEGGGRNFTPYPAGITASVDRKLNPTKSGCITLYPGSVYTINGRISVRYQKTTQVEYRLKA